ncbi:MAG: two-component system sensor histidine kinase DegS [Lentimonas sp.]|jgi:two-component system sensor histidine kinase DegS
MTNNKNSSFATRYKEALGCHVKSPPPSPYTLRRASKLGHAAADTDIKVLDLVRIHEEAIAALGWSSELTKESQSKSSLTAPGSFLIKALKAFEEKQQLLLQNLGDPHQACKDKRTEITRYYSELLKEATIPDLQSKKLAHQILMAHEEERKQISRELHDELAQILSGINVRLALIKQASVLNDRNLAKNILKTQKMVEKSVDMVHSFASRLRPAILDDLGLIPALRSYIQDLRVRNGLNIRFTAMEEVEDLDNLRSTVLYRVAQEALTNVTRHAEAQLATVKLRKNKGLIRLEIHDNGKSFKVDDFIPFRAHQRLGLLGMHERVEMVGGKFTVKSSEGKGTTVCAEIPFQPDEA